MLIGVPTKVLVPPNEKREPYINDFDQNSQVTVMGDTFHLSINAAGDTFPPFLILTLTYLPKNLSRMVLRCQMNIGEPKIDT